MTFDEAIDALAVRSLLPTTGRTADMRQFDSGIKQHALWSATLTSINTLQQIGAGVDAILRGESDIATEMLAVKQSLEAEGYKAPEGKQGTMLDLTSIIRRQTIIETQVNMARGAGWHEQGMEPEVLEAYPAQELFRSATPKGGPEAERDWGARWIKAGGPPAKGGRMIALKTDPVWENLGNPELFPDGLGNRWAPFAIHSNMDLRDSDRTEAIALGLMKIDTPVTPLRNGFAQDLKAKPAVREQWLHEAIEDSGLASFDAVSVLHFSGKEAAA
ncbi:hypothetical protein OPIT5_08325 [Opitutaceae bacterium TAV5]|nr:hypothetical protein OPIT5_08325 [Opitutaceae bacterium TAV5]